MPLLFGQPVTRRELQRHTGDLSQTGGIRLMQLAEGKEAGVRIADVRTGSGLRFQVNLDRGMDISLAEYKGISLAWRSPEGDVHPAYYEPGGKGWLRSFPGGLLTGCGMTTAGAPSEDDGESLGLHGRLSHLPAAGVSSATRWAGTECLLTLRGEVRESVPFGTNLLLERTIETFLGRSVIVLKDRVRNEGPAASPLMMLYHINLGWPLVDDGTRLYLDAVSTRPRDDEARKGEGHERVCSSPVAGFHEQVYYHDLAPDREGLATALLANDRLGLGLFVRYRQEELPRFIQWKMMGEGLYVVGLEPANCLVEGRAKERRDGTLSSLQPGEQEEFQLQCGVLDGPEAIREFIRTQHLN
jgi:hypothetical protein